MDTRAETSSGNELDIEMQSGSLRVYPDRVRFLHRQTRLFQINIPHCASLLFRQRNFSDGFPFYMAKKWASGTIFFSSP